MSTYHITRPQWVKTTAKFSRLLFLSIKQCTIYDWGPPWPQSILLWEPNALINTTNPSKICLKMKNSFLHNFFLNHFIILKFCTEYDSINVILCTKFQKVLLTTITVKASTSFQLKMDLKQIIAIVTSPTPLFHRTGLEAISMIEIQAVFIIIPDHIYDTAAGIAFSILISWLHPVLSTTV